MSVDNSQYIVRNWVKNGTQPKSRNKYSTTWHFTMKFSKKRLFQQTKKKIFSRNKRFSWSFILFSTEIQLCSVFHSISESTDISNWVGVLFHYVLESNTKWRASHARYISETKSISIYLNKISQIQIKSIRESYFSKENIPWCSEIIKSELHRLTVMK